MLLVAIVVTPVVAAQADTTGGSGTTDRAAGAPTIGSDQADYPPGSTVVLSGSNWLPNDTVVINVDDDQGKSWQKDVGVHTTSTGDLTYTFTLPKTFVARYNVSATGSDGRTATSSFTDANSAADLDQCRNGPMSAPVVCTGGAWVNGNANATQAHYLEDDSIVYRMRFDNLALTSHTVTIEWDTTQNGKHALDYLTTYNRTEVGAAPCSGVAGCGGATTFPIPVDPFVAAEGVSQIPGVFTMFNGTITGVSAYTRAGSFDGNSQTSITLTFTAANATPVLAWSAHISTRADWGFDDSAVAISGSPYHMRLLDLDGQGGNQDRSLSTDAVVFPATITIVKDALPDDPTSFSFTASGAEMTPTSFMLVDDGIHPAQRTRSFATLFTFGGSRTVTEGALPTGWALTNINCSITTPSGTKLGTVTPDGDGAGPTATFDLEEANAATCTFTNQFTKGNTTTGTAIHVNGDHTTAVTAVPLGSTVHDSATVSGTGFGAPTGDVTFSWYATNDSCTGTPADAGTVTLVNGVADPSTSFGPLAAGSYSFQAGYGGDSNYDTSEAPCEPLHVAKADTTVVTSIHAGDDHATPVTSVTLGSTVHDSATVSGTAFGAPTGDVTFTWFTERTDCTGPSTDAGTVTLVGGVAYPSTSFGPLPAGSSSFRAHYSGDANYNESDADCEPLRVTKADSTTVTAIHAGDDHATTVTSVALGSTVHDSATVSGTAFGAPTGDVTFTWYTTANDCTGPSTAAGTVTLVAGAADPSSAFGPLPAGDYSFRAHYVGDANYRASDAVCESLTVTKASTTTVTEIHDGDEHVVTSVSAGAMVHDQATVSGSG
jgi:Big-like domain-containing protein